MATSGEMSTSNNKIKYTITVTQNSQSVANNTSNVTVSVRFYRTNTAYETYGTGTVYCKINGTTYSAAVTPSQKITHSGIVLFTKTLDISHADNGTKTLTCSAWISHEMLTSSEQSYSQVLTTIPRKSTLTLTSGTLGSPNTIIVNRNSNSFTHTVKYTCGNYSDTLRTKSTDTSITWTPALEFSEGAPYGRTVYISVEIETFNGSTSLGTNGYGYTCAIPETVVPSVSFTVSEASVPSIFLSQLNALYPDKNVHIQGISTLNVSITASGIYNSVIQSYRTTISDSNGNVFKTYSDSSFTTDAINKSGDLTVKVEVVDSRGRAATSTYPIMMYEYKAPKITSLSVKRCDSDGTISSSGEYLVATFSSSVSPIEDLNSAVYKLKYKKSSESTYTEVTISAYNKNYAVSGGTYVFAADTASSYDCTMTVQDTFSTSSPISVIGSAIKKLFSFLRRGLGIAFGKVAEIENAMEVDFDLYANKDIYDKDQKRITNGLALYTGSGSASGINPDTTLDTLVLTDVNTPTGYFMYIHTMFYSSKSTTSARTQFALPYDRGDNTYYRYYFNGYWSTWVKHVKSSDIGTKILWSGGLHMNGEQTITLSEPVSSQNHGIVLTFSEYNTDTSVVANSAFSNHFVPKTFASSSGFGAHGTDFKLGGMWSNGVKYLYITDTQIKGHQYNTKTSLTVGGITYTNDKYVLRMVTGV